MEPLASLTAACSGLQRKPTRASEAVARVAFLAEAPVGAHGVLAVCVLAAHVGSVGAFVQILREQITAL